MVQSLVSRPLITTYNGPKSSQSPPRNNHYDLVHLHLYTGWVWNDESFDLCPYGFVHLSLWDAGDAGDHKGDAKERGTVLLTGNKEVLNWVLRVCVCVCTILIAEEKD